MEGRDGEIFGVVPQGSAEKGNADAGDFVMNRHKRPRGPRSGRFSPGKGRNGCPTPRRSGTGAVVPRMARFAVGDGVPPRARGFS